MSDLEYEAVGELLDMCEGLDPERASHIRMKLTSARLVRRMRERPEPPPSFTERLRAAQPVFVVVTLLLLLLINLLGVDTTALQNTLKGIRL